MSKIVNLSYFSQNDESIYLAKMTQFWEGFGLYWELSEGGFHLWSAYLEAGNTVVKSDLPLLAAAANLLIIEYNKERILYEGYPEFEDYMELLSSYYELNPEEIKKMSIQLKASMMKIGFNISPLAWNERAEEFRRESEADDDEFDDDDSEFEQEANRILQNTCNFHVRIILPDGSPLSQEIALAYFINNITVGEDSDQLIKLYKISKDENDISFSIDCKVGFLMIMCEKLEEEYRIKPSFDIVRDLNENAYVPDRHYSGFMDIYRDMNIPELEDENELHRYLEKFNALSPEERRKNNPNAREDDEYAAILLYDLPATKGVEKAQQILKTNKHNIEAQILIAGWESDLEKRIDLLEAASDIHNLDYDYKRIQKDKMWWGESHTRPFMRAKFLLAKTYEIGGYITDARDSYTEIISMNPSDNQGARIDLMKLLYKTGDTKEIISLANKFPDDPFPYIAFAGVYASFMKNGKSSKTEKRIINSLHSNYYIACTIAKIDTEPVVQYFDLPEDEDSILFDHFEEFIDDILLLFKNAELMKYYRKVLKEILNRVIN